MDGAYSWQFGQDQFASVCKRKGGLSQLGLGCR
jgi:hypothetical protein